MLRKRTPLIGTYHPRKHFVSATVLCRNAGKFLDDIAPNLSLIHAQSRYRLAEERCAPKVAHSNCPHGVLNSGSRCVANHSESIQVGAVPLPEFPFKVRCDSPLFMQEKSSPDETISLCIQRVMLISILSFIRIRWCLTRTDMVWVVTVKKINPLWLDGIRRSFNIEHNQSASTIYPIYGS